MLGMMNETLAIFFQKKGCSIGFKPDYKSFASILKSCAAISDIKLGNDLHNHVVKLGHISCQLVSKALLNVYAKCNALDDCQKLFGQLSHCDAVMWNIVLSGFARSRSHDTEVMRLFQASIIGMDPKPSSVTISIVLPGCNLFVANVWYLFCSIDYFFWKCNFL